MEGLLQIMSDEQIARYFSVQLAIQAVEAGLVGEETLIGLSREIFEFIKGAKDERMEEKEGDNAGVSAGGEETEEVVSQR